MFLLSPAQALPLALAESALLKLADFHLATTAVLAAAVLATGLLRQPAQRLAIAWASTAGVALLLVLVMIPGWSIFHLGTTAPVFERTVEPFKDASPMPASRERVATTPTPPPSFDRNAVAEPVAEAAPAAKDWRTLRDTAIAVATLGGAVLAIGWLVWGAIAARRIVAQAKPAGAESLRLLDELAAPAPSPRLMVSDRLGTAVAIGLRRPTILLPRPMAASGASTDLRAVLAHELAHVRGGDLWLLAGLRLAMVVLWLNPLYWALRRRVRLDQETLADAAAAELAGRHAYAERLVSWARDLAAPPRLAGAAGIWEGPSQLRSRIAVLLDERFTVLQRCSTKWRAATGLLCGALALAASLVSLSPAAPDAASAGDQARGTATLSGKIVVVGSGPSDVAGWLYSGSVIPSNVSYSTEGKFTDRFECEVASGTINLRFYPNEAYAPAVVGPFNLKDGDKIDDIVIQLTPGLTAPLVLRDEDGQAVAGATVVKYAKLNGSSNGPVREEKTDSDGKLLLERLAPGVLYEFRIDTPGYQPLRAVDVSIPRNGRPLTFTMKRARPATGVVRLPSGDPCPGAKLMLLSEVEASGFNNSHPSGILLAETDEEGRFTLDSLGDGFRYLIIVEAPDESRVVSIDIEAGKSDLEIVIPKRRDLLIRVRGDIDDLPKRDGEPYARVQQRFEVMWGEPAVGVSEVFAPYVPLERTTGGAQAIFRGLAINPGPGAAVQTVEVMLGDDGDLSKTVSIDPDPEHMGLVQFNLASAGDDALDVMEDSESVTYVPIGAPADVFAPVAGDYPQARPDIPNTVRGECLDESGKPLAGVKVQLHAATFDLQSNELRDEATTDARGQFRFDKVVANAADLIEQGPEEAGEDLIVLSVTKAGRVSKTYAERDYGAAAVGLHVRFVLPPAATVKGRVTDADGQPVAGATVRVRDGVLSLNDSIHATVTDAEGRYAIDDLPAKDYQRFRQEQLRRHQQASESYSAALFQSPSTIEASHPDYAVATAPLPRSPGEVDLQLLPRADLTGRVVDEEGGPLAGVRVVISAKWQTPPAPTGGANNWVPAQAVTDDAGRYRVSNLPPGDYEVAAFSGVEGLPKLVPAGPVAVKAEPQGDSGTATQAAELRFTSGRLVQVQLIDETSGEPLRFTEPMVVSIYYIAGADGGPQRGVSNMNLKVSPEGRFECRVLAPEGRLMAHALYREGEFESQGEWRPVEKVAIPSAEELGDAVVRYPVNPGAVSIGTLLKEADRLADSEDSEDSDGAIAFLTEQLASRPGEVNLLAKRAQLADGLGKEQQALDDYETILAAEPSNFVALNNLAHLLVTADDASLYDAPRALQLAKKANELLPRPYHLTLDTLAAAQVANGDIDGAIKTLDQAIEVAPESARAELRELRDLYRKQRDMSSPE
ncbi:M56 family metallopeptidase [Botrimarina mediterranea]|uniref:Regulatory protein BlaR1 n=1 Tax=Botrimarina mediterranea TaxID=2528022 RepID=A0A518K953_9BACT|nr:M56 family metallopeptidase [Botrimarina mediterranea]QDV74307.1 Regulatory protein BlaR1 [Botrimarina mediterranea]